MSAERLVTQGQKQLDEGDVNSAVDWFNQALQSDPNHPKALIGLARCFLLASGQEPNLAERAGSLLEKVLRIAPKDAEAVIYRGVVDEAQGNINKARQHYERGVALDPRLFIGHFNLGRAAGQMNIGIPRSARWRRPFVSSRRMSAEFIPWASATRKAGTSTRPSRPFDDSSTSIRPVSMAT